jgi:threonine aldolase
MSGGRIWPLVTIREVCEAARTSKLRTHLDGARLLNAVVATGVSAKEYAFDFDTAWIDLSKGLGAPVGAVLAGTKEFVQEAWQWKQRLGGSMRQAGIIAAGGVYALRNHVNRLVDDHQKAKRLAEGFTDISGVEVDPNNVETNIVIFEISRLGFSTQEVAPKLLDSGLRLSVVNGQKQLRAVTHLDISWKDIEDTLQIIKKVIEN